MTSHGVPSYPRGGHSMLRRGLNSGIFSLKHESSIFRSFIQPCMWFLHDGTALYCLAQGELAWHFQNHTQGRMNGLKCYSRALERRCPTELYRQIIEDWTQKWKVVTDAKVDGGGHVFVCPTAIEPIWCHCRRRRKKNNIISYFTIGSAADAYSMGHQVVKKVLL